MKHQSSFALLAILCGASLLSPCQAGKIHDAVAKRDLVALELVLNKEPKQVNARCYPDFDTPLHMAVVAGDPAMVKLLLDAGAEITTPGVGLLPFNPLQRAAIAPCDLLLQDTMSENLQEQVQKSNIRQAEVMAAVSDAENAARVEVLALLLAKKPELNKGFPAGNPPLHLAVRMGNTAMVKLLIRSGADVNTRSELWLTPLHIAAMSRVNRDMFEAIITAGADVEASSKTGKTPLILAARSGSAIGVETLLSHRASAESEDDQQIPAIGAAARAGHDDIVRLIHQKGGPDLIRYAKKEVLFLCAAMGGSKALTEILLANGVDINIRDAEGFTPLLSASESGHWELSEYLIAKGADRKAKTNDGRCLFDIVCQQGNTALAKEMLEADGWPQGSPNLLSKIILAGRVDILQLLVERQVDILNIGPTYAEGGIGALQLAVMGSDLSLEDSTAANVKRVAAEEDYARMVELLLEHGAKVDPTNRPGTNALDLAAGHCGGRVIKALLKAGGKPDMPNTTNHITPLQIAARVGRAEAVQVMLDAGANPKAVTESGQTLLHLAAAQGNGDVLKLLIEKGLSVNEKEGSFGATPLHGATMANSLECVRLLLAAGARADSPDSANITPLLWAVNRVGRMEILKSKPTDNGAKLQIMAANLLDRLRIIHLLIESGAKTDIIFPDAKESEPRTLIEFAEKNGSPEIVELLENPPPVARKPAKR